MRTSPTSTRSNDYHDMIELRLFGPPVLADSDGKPLALAGSQPKRLALLAYLAAAQPHGSHSRDTLLAMFWPELNDARARAALNQSIYALRRALGPDAVVSMGDDRLALASDRVWCDVQAFEELFAAGSMESAMVHWRGAFLEGFFLSEVPDFEHWVDTQRMRLEEKASAAAWKVADHAADRGDAAEALHCAQRARAVGRDLDEPALRRVLELYDRLGDRTGAIREYELFAARVDEEFGSVPSPETVELIEQVRARDIAHSELMLELTALRSDEAYAASLLRPPATRGMRTARTAAALAVIALGAVGSWAFFRDDAPAGGVAIFPFTYTGNESSAHFADGVARLMAANLNGVGELRSVDPNAVANAAMRATSPVTAQSAARMAGAFKAELVVVGRVVVIGDKVRISASLFPRLDVNARTDATVEGSPGQIFQLADQLTTQLLAGRTETSGALYRSAMRTTSSPAALRAYIEGEKSYQAGRHDAAAALFQRAVEIDTTFALAYLRLSQAGNWNGRNQLAEFGAAGALRNAHRLSATDRLQVTAWDHYLRGNIDLATREYRTVLEADSSNVEAWAYLAEIGFHWGPSFGRSSADSRAQWEGVLRLSPMHLHAMQHLARIAARQGRLLSFDSLMHRIAAIEPAAATTVELEVLRAFSFGDKQDRIQATKDVAPFADEIRKSIVHTVASSSPDMSDIAGVLAPTLRIGRTFDSYEAGEMVLAAGVLLARGEQRAAGALLDSAAVIESNRVLEYRSAAQLVPLIPSSPAALRASGEALGRPVSGPGASYPLTAVWRLYLQAVLATRAMDDAAAASATRSLEIYVARRDTSDQTRFAGVFLRLVRAENLRARKQPAAALAALGEPRIDPDRRLPRIWTYHRPHERFLRAELLSDLGRKREALQWYATFPDPTAYDILYLPAAELRQAQVYAQLGERASAAEHVRRLKLLWKSADPAARAALDSILLTLPAFTR
jgi:DNA-binding SARP family transcriptional activator/TolB-like protein